MFTLRPKLGANPNSFFQILEKRVRQWSGAHIAARIIVPPSLAFWYWQEFGTAAGGRIGATDSTGGASGSNYPIPKEGTTFMTWPTATGGQVVAYKVSHPGVPSHHFVTRTLQDNLQLVAIKIISALDRSRWNPSSVRQSLVEEVMPRVKENIVANIEISLPGVRPDGRLEGATAAEVFEQEATIVDSSDIFS